MANLSHDVDDSTLEGLFSEHETVEIAKVIIDRESRGCDMEELIVKICGEGVDDFPAALESKQPDAHIRKEGDSWLFLSEQFYRRINSNLLTVLFCRVVSPTECRVRLITGGGGVGLLKIAWGSETSQNDSLVQIIERLCDHYGWEIVSLSNVSEPEEIPADDLSSKCKCISCGGVIPVGSDTCRDCGWTYKNTDDG